MKLIVIFIWKIFEHQIQNLLHTAHSVHADIFFFLKYRVVLTLNKIGVVCRDFAKNDPPPTFKKTPHHLLYNIL